MRDRLSLTKSVSMAPWLTRTCGLCSRPGPHPSSWVWGLDSKQGPGCCGLPQALSISSRKHL